MCVVEDSFCILQVSIRWTSGEGYKLVKSKHVVVEANPEDLGMNLFEMGH